MQEWRVPPGKRTGEHGGTGIGATIDEADSHAIRRQRCWHRAWSVEKDMELYESVASASAPAATANIKGK